MLLLVWCGLVDGAEGGRERGEGGRRLLAGFPPGQQRQWQQGLQRHAGVVYFGPAVLCVCVKGWWSGSSGRFVKQSL